MQNTLTQAEVDAVLNLPADVRYDYFVKQVVDEKKVWGLVSESGWSLAADGERTCLALWSHETFARLCAVDAWAEAVPQSLSLDQFKELLENLDQQGLKVAVFMTPDAQGRAVEPEALWNSLWQCLTAEIGRA